MTETFNPTKTQKNKSKQQLHHSSLHQTATTPSDVICHHGIICCLQRLECHTLWQSLETCAKWVGYFDIKRVHGTQQTTSLFHVFHTLCWAMHNSWSQSPITKHHSKAVFFLHTVKHGRWHQVLQPERTMALVLSCPHPDPHFLPNSCWEPCQGYAVSDQSCCSTAICSWQEGQLQSKFEGGYVACLINCSVSVPFKASWTISDAEHAVTVMTVPNTAASISCMRSDPWACTSLARS